MSAFSLSRILSVIAKPLLFGCRSASTGLPACVFYPHLTHSGAGLLSQGLKPRFRHPDSLRDLLEPPLSGSLARYRQPGSPTQRPSSMLRRITVACRFLAPSSAGAIPPFDYTTIVIRAALPLSYISLKAFSGLEACVFPLHFD